MYRTEFTVIEAIFQELTAGNQELTEKYLHLTDVQRGYNTIQQIIEERKIEDPNWDLDSAISMYAHDSERQGFINGFRMAQQFMKELIFVPSPSDGVLGGLDYVSKIQRDKDVGVYDFWTRSKTAAAEAPSPASGVQQSGMDYAFSPQQGVYTAVSELDTRDTDQSRGKEVTP